MTCERWSPPCFFGDGLPTRPGFTSGGAGDAYTKAGGRLATECTLGYFANDTFPKTQRQDLGINMALLPVSTEPLFDQGRNLLQI